MLGAALASWAIGQHLYHIRQTFPADSQGPFTGQDLRVLRFLSATPSAVRDLQRRMRGVTKQSCLRSLRRAVDAGLAIEQERERFIALPPPARGLSDYLNEHGRPGDMAAASKGSFF